MNAQSDAASIDRALARALVATDAALVAVELARIDPQLLAARARLHGIGALLHARFATLPETSGGAALAAIWRDQARLSAMFELGHRPVLARALAALGQAGVAAVVLKGSALAYTVYPSPALRARSDSDVLIDPTQRAAAEAALVEAGFTRALRVPGELLSYQVNYSAHGAGGERHQIDLHWRINNASIIAERFDFAALSAASVPLAAFGLGARGAGPAHALAIAALHHQASRGMPYYVDGVAHTDPDRLIWLYDLVLLTRAMDVPARARLLAIAEHSGIGPVLAASLRRAAEFYADPALGAAADQCAALPGDPQLVHWLGARGWSRRRIEFAALGGWSRRWQFVRENLFPELGYLRARYHDAGDASRAGLTVRRWLAGARRVWRG